MAYIEIISVIRLWNKSSSGGGGGLMQGIKIPQHDFAIKMKGGHKRGGGGICGTLRYLLSYEYM